MSVTVQTETFFIRKGDDFIRAITVKQNGVLLDMTNYTFEMDIRSCIDDSSTIIELTIANGRIDISQVAQGIIIININNVDTLALDEQKAVCDLKWIDTNSDKKTILQEVVEILETVTR